MKLKLIVLTLTLSLSSHFFAQSQESIEERGIHKVVIYETDFEEGEKDKRIIEERVYDAQANLIEYKEYDDYGKAEVWEKYAYNEQGKMISETFLNAKGEQEKRIEHIYVDGLKREKRYYDHKNRLSKTKYYEYSYHQ